jgi:hypothetical protein
VRYLYRISLCIAAVIIILQLCTAAPAVEKGIVPGNRHALMLAPYEHQFHHAFPSVEDSLHMAGYDVTKYVNDQVELKNFRELGDYGVVFVFTHGSSWHMPVLGDQSCLSTWVPYSWSMYYSNITDFLSGKLTVVGIDGEDKAMVGVCNSYLEAKNNRLPDSLFYAFACDVMDNNSMFDSLRPLGAQAVMGFSRLGWSKTNPGAPDTEDDRVTNEFFRKACDFEVSVEDAYDSAKGKVTGWELKTKYEPGGESFYLNSGENQNDGRLPKIPDETAPPSNGDQEGNSSIVGRYHCEELDVVYLKFNADGTCSGYIGGLEPYAVHGTYTMSGDTLTILDENGNTIDRLERHGSYFLDTSGMRWVKD